MYTVFKTFSCSLSTSLISFCLLLNFPQKKFLFFSPVFFVSPHFFLSLALFSSLSGFAEQSHGWRTAFQRTPCRPCSRSWRISVTTDDCTNHPKFRRNVSWRSTSTHCRLNSASATGRRSCPQRGRWSR